MLIRNLNKKADQKPTDTSIKQKVVESVTAKLDQQKQQIRNRLQNLPFKDDKKAKRVEATELKTIELPSSPSHLTKPHESPIHHNTKEESHMSKDESNLFDTKVDIAQSYLNENKSSAQYPVSNSKVVTSKPQTNSTTIHKVINSIESFAVIEQKLKNDFGAKTDKDVDSELSVPKTSALMVQKHTTGAYYELGDENGARNSYIDGQHNSRDDRQIEEAEHNEGIDIDDTEKDESVASLKNYLYDDMLGCYYDPVTNEYYAECAN